MRIKLYENKFDVTPPWSISKWVGYTKIFFKFPFCFIIITPNVSVSHWNPIVAFLRILELKIANSIKYDALKEAAYIKGFWNKL